MPIDDHGVPERNIQTNLFSEKRTNPTTQNDADGEEQIWVTDDLKTAAREFSNSWSKDDTENLNDQDIDTLHLKFKSVDDKTRFLIQLTESCLRKSLGITNCKCAFGPCVAI